MNQAILGVTYNGIVLADNDPAIVRLQRLFPGFSVSWDRVYDKYPRIPVDCGHLFIDLAVLERRLFASVGIFGRKNILRVKRGSLKNKIL